jgi:NADH-quinone oxidoreductase subunit A
MIKIYYYYYIIEKYSSISRNLKSAYTYFMSTKKMFILKCEKLVLGYKHAVNTFFNRKSIEDFLFMGSSKKEYNSFIVSNVFLLGLDETSKQNCKKRTRSNFSDACFKISIPETFHEYVIREYERMKYWRPFPLKERSSEYYDKLESLTTPEEIAFFHVNDYLDFVERNKEALEMVDFLINEHFEKSKKGPSLDEEQNMLINALDSVCENLKEIVIREASDILLDRSETVESWKGYVSEWTPEYCAKLDALTTREETFHFVVNEIVDAHERRERGRVLQYWKDLIEYTPEYYAKLDALTTREETFNFIVNEHINAHTRHLQSLESIVNNFLTEHYPYVPQYLLEIMQKKLVKLVNEYFYSVLDFISYVPKEVPIDYDSIDDAILYRLIWPNFFYKNTLYTTFESLIITEYFTILIYLSFSILLSYAILGFSYIFVVQNPETEKMSAYECGFEPYEDARQKFDVKFYIIAMLFIIFDIETMYLIPWCSALPYINSTGYLIMMEFIFELSVSFLYIWCVGGFDWD